MKSTKDLRVDTMPSSEGTAMLRMEWDRSGINVYLGEREIWIEVSDKDDLVAHVYRDQHTEEVTTVTIKRDVIEFS